MSFKGEPSDVSKRLWLKKRSKLCPNVRIGFGVQLKRQFSTCITNEENVLNNCDSADKGGIVANATGTSLSAKDIET